MVFVSRREALAGSAASLVAMSAGPAQAAAVANPAGLRLLTSVDGVNTAPRAGGIMKFSFANPEPSVGFAGLLFGFEVVSFENNYGIDPAAVTLTRSGDTLVLKAAGLTMAGGTRKRAGELTASLTRTAAGAIEWQVTTALDQPVKAVKTIVRGLPRGRLSSSAENWVDHGDAEKVFEYPALMGGMATPLLAIEGKDGRVHGISALQEEVRPARFAFLPGRDGYKVELLYEQAGWDRRGDVTTCAWRIATARDFAGIAAPHFAAVRAAYGLPDFASRRDAPDWMKHIGLVLAPRAGTRVLPRHRWNLLDPDVLIWAFTGEPDPELVRSLFELRALVEPGAAAVAAERRTRADIKTMRDALTAMARHGLDTEAGQGADRNFHDAILRATGNEYLMFLSTSIGTAVTMITQFKQRLRALPRDPIPDHRRVFDAIAAGDTELARGAMRILVDLALEDTRAGVSAPKATPPT